ncbi:hypothetical protein MPTK1_7g04540 [Marchantia polymorpha subsp. ruderalis]|uniref:Uncharacterized protein n=2 Tax=Marchantia polymorpha TaxID=3197 RepID=A0AAF6BW44_MARPO|nr:hypothetical protein MARPO_0062s0071 [Marchantia polymorpha]BBN16228.1 hypothetical protein Mp_7g04540 [Marchantia polymorpha subsp. ruderalis]|eukprot:PTQ36653.1 hypothetical protein MARPO_0062s0071 [Marchantia polymorpha]
MEQNDEILSSKQRTESAIQRPELQVNSDGRFINTQQFFPESEVAELKWANAPCMSLLPHILESLSSFGGTASVHCALFAAY